MTFSEELAQAISNWLVEKPNRSLSMISRMTSVSYSSVRRAAQRECEPTQETCLAIASVVMQEESYQSFANRYWPTLKKYVADVACSTSQSEQAVAYMRSEGHCKIIVLASGNGTTEQEVKDLFGLSALTYFNDLIDSGHLVKTDEDRWQFQGYFGSASFDLARSILGSFTKMYDRKNDYLNGVSTSWVGWEAVNEQTARELNKLAADYCFKASQKIRDPQNKGDVVVFAGVLSNILKGEELIS